jgi:phosphatidylglycerol:prolipoprotein diacylglycerol transferase
MYPVLHFGSISVSSYQTCLAVAFLVGVTLLLRANRSAEVPYRMGSFVLIPIYLGSLVGAKLMFLLIPENAAPAARVLSLWKGGYWYHGGLIGGIASYALYNAAKGNSIVGTLDLAAPFVCLGEGITRIGCFLDGCCWGAPVSVVPGVVFPPDSHAWAQQLQAGMIGGDAAGSLPVHAVQLYMALSMIAVFILLRFVGRKEVAVGNILLLFFLLHCFVRFWLELFRADIMTYSHGLSVTQWLAMAGYGVALAALFLLRARTRSEDAGPASRKEALSWQ